MQLCGDVARLPFHEYRVLAPYLDECLGLFSGDAELVDEYDRSRVLPELLGKADVIIELSKRDHDRPFGVSGDAIGLAAEEPASRRVQRSSSVRVVVSSSERHNVAAIALLQRICSASTAAYLARPSGVSSTSCEREWSAFGTSESSPSATKRRTVACTL
jgi:hypothetical protein